MLISVGGDQNLRKGTILNSYNALHVLFKCYELTHVTEKDMCDSFLQLVMLQKLVYAFRVLHLTLTST